MPTEIAVQRQINYKIMRVIIGLIAILLSPFVYMLSGVGSELTSISISYWTDSHDIFVGSVAVIGFFLSAYNGGGEGIDIEYITSKLACFYAICVATFPTKGFTSQDVPYSWVKAIADSIGLTCSSIHNATAILLFMCLIALLWFFSVHAMEKGVPYRAWIYRGIVALMVVGAALIALLWKAFDWKDTLFYVEFWELTLFGAGWLVAGTYRDGKQEVREQEEDRDR